MYHAVKLIGEKCASVISIARGTLTALFAGFFNFLPRYVFEIVQSDVFIHANIPITIIKIRVITWWFM